MEILKFTIESDFAHFRIPENNKINFTFPQIHKTTIKGILGAIVGLKGYNTTSFLKEDKVEFIEKLKGLKVGIIPNTFNGIFKKEIIQNVNQSGHASKEEGGVLIFKEEVLLNPSWTIYIEVSNLETSVREKIKEYLLNSWSEYSVYLGKNHYIADIENVEVVDFEIEEEPEFINSLFKRKDVEIDDLIESNDELAYGDKPFLTSFHLPLDISSEQRYEGYGDFYFTNFPIDNIKDKERLFITDKDKVIELF